ncbi:unnamed protein product [Allacma fusca]|uniref:Fucosyltransferase n=1 Tax=Allacma fusca TaxID=39272 RepID=A0A8J2JNS8_9HEXA|nr:unnamed protein product [Allacma fusca]
MLSQQIGITNVTNIHQNHKPKEDIPPELPTSQPARLKRILFWTPFFGDTSLKDYGITNGEDSQHLFCPYKCEFTANKELLNSSDAVLFHSRDLQATDKQGPLRPLRVPETRIWNQHWIFYDFESPAHTPAPLEAFNNFFNHTLSYRLTSGIYIPYRRLLPRSLEEINKRGDVPKTIQKKRKLIAWIVSNCEAPSRRMELVNQLKKYIPVDVYGKCGNLTCPPKDFFQYSCYKGIRGNYKFYLSLENSLCEDYVTEKFFNALDAGMVPVVYGGANYLKHAVEGSYININSFNSTKELADHLLMLDKNQKEYLKHFDWTKWLQVDRISTLPRAWCTLCERLTVGSLPVGEAMRDLKRWWFHKQGSDSPACSPPNYHLLGREGP